MSKVFIVGLPRTGTTSVCVACLSLGYKTAHTAYTRDTFRDAQVIADTPIFNDYKQLSVLYPDAKYIYLDRDLSLWLPSIAQLLTRMSSNLFSEKGGFNDTIKRCYLETFSGLTANNTEDYAFLTQCYEGHKHTALDFFKAQKLTHLLLNLSKPDAMQQLATYLGVDSGAKMPFLNKKGKVTAWNAIRDPLKIASTRQGKVDKDELLLVNV
ncbi:sulfotransferase family protein [Pseudoalteromonas aurantia]|uniref:Sulfotransferase family protein n=1 Tax=Pseudoalteromonas aurantia TaxID=43654 RepID=A0A5S3VE33_9GAMM|nr:sulfotransferase family protein [Pseudoalteromonas aurantia]TMO56574.1 sulfotransferase family protein [Pseudoalteromonas aurantia]TMO70593.1 sulfotransferase family protein [Pseudoalteromonas aurantia]TMO73518.1 sulfotransferase family protein [Pseudoalteromonas aurantia]